MKTIIFVLTALFFVSCSSGNSDQESAAKTPQAATPAYDHSLVKGQVTDSVVCKNQGNQNYALYLPSYYTPDKKFPCIYLFDSHARGGLPVRSYKDLAEKYGFILIGSNISKNGMQWPETNDVVKVLMDDSRARINIDPRRIYTSGFSGGSRVASSVAILDGGVAGVIGCAAGFPQVDQAFEKKFDYSGMAGVYDFNFNEMVQLDQALQQYGFPHQLLTFTGKHEWPAAADFQTALLWIQVNAIKEQLQPKNDTLVAAFKDDYDRRIAEAKSAGDIISEHAMLDGIVQSLNGLTDITAYKEKLDELTNGKAYKNAIVLQGQLQQAESNQQHELAQDFTQQDGKWWAAKIAELDKKSRTAKTKQEAQMNKRLVSFCSLLGYMNTDHALKADDIANAETFLKIFKLADPDNPDCDILGAIYYMKKGNPQAAITALNEAASLGYSDISLLLTEPSFSSLHNDAGFEKVAEKVREHARK